MAKRRRKQGRIAAAKVSYRLPEDIVSQLEAWSKITEWSESKIAAHVLRAGIAAIGVGATGKVKVGEFAAFSAVLDGAMSVAAVKRKHAAELKDARAKAYSKLPSSVNPDDHVF